MEFSGGNWAVPVKVEKIVEPRSSGAFPRAAYTPPAIRAFGQVGVLTQSGTGLSPEMTAGMGMCSGSTKQSMC